MKFLERELDIRESADQSVEREEAFDRHQLEEKETPMVPTASGLMAKPVACTFCNGPRNPKQCSVSISVEGRFKKNEGSKGLLLLSSKWTPDECMEVSKAMPMWTEIPHLTTV